MTPLPTVWVAVMRELLTSDAEPPLPLWKFSGSHDSAVTVPDMTASAFTDLPVMTWYSTNRLSCTAVIPESVPEGRSFIAVLVGRKSAYGPLPEISLETPA